MTMRKKRKRGEKKKYKSTFFHEPKGKRNTARPRKLWGRKEDTIYHYLIMRGDNNRGVIPQPREEEKKKEMTST